MEKSGEISSRLPSPCEGERVLSFRIRIFGEESCRMVKEEIDAPKEYGSSDIQIPEAVAIAGCFNSVNTPQNVFGLGREG